jgi:DNA-binding MarR family transcriptional regulator
LFSAEAGSGDLTPRQLTLLIALEAMGSASQTDLVEATGIDRSTLADMVSRMTAKDLIARKRLDTDARANQIKLTARGARLLKAHQAALKKTDAALLAAIPAAQRAAFLKALTAIATAGRE